MVLTWTSQKPSPSSSLAYSPRPWLTCLWSYPQAHRRALSHMTENRKVWSRKSLNFQHTIFGFCLKKTCLRQSPQACRNTVFVRINKRTWRNSRFHERLNRLWLHVSNHVDDNVTTPLSHPKDGWPLFVQCATTTCAFESVSTSFAPLVLYHLRLPFMACNYIGFVVLYLV
jgi:hypothetical protein